MLKSLDNVLGHGLGSRVASNPSSSIEYGPAFPAINEFAVPSVALYKAIRKAVLAEVGKDRHPDSL
jgi:hypothetical protein